MTTLPAVHSMIQKPLAAVLITAALMGLALGACSGNGDSTATDDNSSNNAEQDSNGDFSEPAELDLDTYTARLDAAEDRCEVFSVALEPPATNPQTPAETQQATEALVALMNKMASTTDDTENSNLLRTSSEALASYATEVAFDPGKLDMTGNGPDIPAMADAQTALTIWMQAAASDCSAYEVSPEQ